MEQEMINRNSKVFMSVIWNNDVFVRSFSGSSEGGDRKYIPITQSLQPDQAQKAYYQNKTMPAYNCLITYITSP